MACLAKLLPRSPPWGGAGGWGCWHVKNPAVPQLLTGKEMPPLRPSPGRGDKGGISGQLRRCGRIPGAGPTAADVPQSAQRDWRGGRRPRGSTEGLPARRCFSGPWRA